MPDVTLTIRAVNEAKRALEQAEGQLKGVGHAAEDIGDKSRGGFRDAAAGVKDFTQAALGTVAIVQGVANAVGDFVDRGADVKNVSRAFGTYVEIMGEDVPGALGAMRDATAGMISDFDLMQSGARLAAMGIATNTDEMAQLTEIAVVLGGAMGKGPTAAMEEFALMLANRSIPRLDTFGISAGTVRERIKELKDAGYNADEAFRLAVIEDATPKLEALGGAADLAGGGIDRLGARLQNLGDKVAVGVLDVVDAAATSLDQLIQISETLAASEIIAISIAPTVDQTELTELAMELARMGHTEAEIEVRVARRAEIIKLKETLTELGYTEAEIDVILHDEELAALARRLDGRGGVLAQALIDVALADPTLKDISDIFIAKTDWPDAKIAALISDPTFAGVVAQIQDYTDWGDAEVAAALAEGGLQPLANAIATGEFDPATTSLVLAETAAADFSAEISEIDSIETQVIAIAFDEQPFIELEARLTELEADPVLIEAVVQVERLAGLREQMQDIGVIDVDLAMRAERIRQLTDDLQAKLASGEYALDFELMPAMSGASSVSEWVRNQIGDEDYLLPFDAQLNPDALRAEAIEQGLDPVEVQAQWDKGVFSYLAEQAEHAGIEITPEMRVLLEGGAASDLADQLSGLDIPPYEMAVLLDTSGEDMAELIEQILPPVSAALFIGAESIAEVQQSMAEAGIEIPAKFNAEAIATDLEAAGVSDIAIAAFIEEQSMADMRQQMSEAGVDNVLIDLTLADGATEAAQTMTDQLILAADAAERVEEASRGIDEALGGVDASGLARDLEEAFSFLTDEEAALELSLGLGTTTDAAVAFDEMMAEIEAQVAAGGDEAEAIEMALALKPMLESGQVTTAMLESVTTAMAEGGLEAGVATVVNFEIGGEGGVPLSADMTGMTSTLETAEVLVATMTEAEIDMGADATALTATETTATNIVTLLTTVPPIELGLLAQLEMARQISNELRSPVTKEVTVVTIGGGGGIPEAAGSY